MSQPPLVSLIVVNRNGQPHLERLMPSLEALAYPKDRLEVIVVDNRSSDGSVQWLAKRYPHVRILAHQQNNFCAANNFGVRHATGNLLGMVNNDCWVEPKWLDRLVAAIQQDQRIGAVGSKILFEDGTIDSVGLHELPNFYWADVGFYEPDQGQHETPQERLAVCAASMLIRRECFEEVGGFDEDFAFYYEDVDWCLRCRRQDWQIRYVPDSIAWHRLHGTASAELVRWYRERNRLLLVAKHVPQHLPSALESAPFFLEHESLGPLCHVIEVTCAKLLQTHGNALTAEVLSQLVQRFTKFARSHSQANVTTLQRTLGRVRDDLERKKVEQYELTLVKDAVDRSLQLLAEEVDTQHAMIAQLHRQGAEHASLVTATAAALQHAQETVQSTQQQLAETQQHDAVLRQTHEDMQRAHGALQQAHADLEQAYTQLHENHLKLQAVQISLHADHARLEERHATVEKDHGALQQAHADLQQAYDAILEHHEALQADRAALQAAHDRLQEQSAVRGQEYAALQQTQANLQHTLAALKAEHGALQRADEELRINAEVFRAEHEALQERHTVLQTSHAALQEQITAGEREQAALQQTHQQLRAEHHALLEAHGRVFHDREELRQEVQRLRRTPWWVARDTVKRLSARMIARGFAAVISRALLWKDQRARSSPSTHRRGSMRTARVLKMGSWLGLLAGGALAAEAMVARPAVAIAWLAIGVAGTISLRMLANIGQLLFEQRGETQRILSNVERSLYQQAALTKELRDMVKERAREARERVPV